MTDCGLLYPKGWFVKIDVPCARPEGHLGQHQAFEKGLYSSKPDMLSCLQWEQGGGSVTPIREEKDEYHGICVECDIRVQGEKTICHNCAHWLDHIQRTADKRIVVNGSHYLVGPVGGFGGAKWIIEFLDPEREGFTTHQLWYQGKIPSHFRDRIPDNARFIQEKVEHSIAGTKISWDEFMKGMEQDGN